MPAARPAPARGRFRRLLTGQPVRVQGPKYAPSKPSQDQVQWPQEGVTDPDNYLGAPGRYRAFPQFNPAGQIYTGNCTINVKA